MPLPLLRSSKTLVIAHRGASGHAPENTLAAFRLGLEAGADLVELDYHMTADGRPIVIHDATLDRTTDARVRFGREKVAVASLRWEEIQPLDAGSWRSSDFKDERLPTLSEAIELIQTQAVTLIERKAGDAANCVALLKEMKLLEKVVVQSFDWDFIAECHALAPELSLGALGDKELTVARMDRAAEIGAQVVGWSHKTLQAQHAPALRDRGLRLWSYTVNNAAIARRLKGWGVSGLITDYPAEMREWLAEK